MPSPEERAASLITDNRYLSLATRDSSGPWVAPINYVVGPDDCLHFYSAVEARHSRALADAADSAVAIFNSQASSEEVDGLQASGRCTAVPPDELETVHSHYFEVNFTSPEERAWWLRPADEFTGDGKWRFYRLSLEEIFVIDFESIENERVDRRVAVDAVEMWRLVPPGVH